MMLFTIDYQWILIGGILLTMLIIGYIADSTDFGHKKKSPKAKEQPMRNPNKVEKKQVVEDITPKVDEEDLNVPFGDTIKMPVIETPDVSNIEDLNVPIESVPMDDFKNEPLQDVVPTEVIKPEEPITEKEVKNIELPKTDKNQTSEKLVPEYIAEQYNPNQEVSSDDDIWNF